MKKKSKTENIIRVCEIQNELAENLLNKIKEKNKKKTANKKQKNNS